MRPPAWANEAGRGPSTASVAALGELRGTIKGDVRADQLSRALYATDASIYEIVPDGVVFPRCVADVVATVRACGRHSVPLTARGAGTGLAGGAVNRGVQLDCSRYLDRIGKIDLEARCVWVEAGVVLDELNAALAPHGFHFAPDVATSSRATLGGMIANDSCGAHSIIYGRTADHVLGVDVVLSDGSTCCWGQVGSHRLETGATGLETGATGLETGAARKSALAERCERVLADVARECADEISARYPTILRHSGGYALDRLQVQEGRINPETVVCGSEGTLGIVVGATLRITPLPKHRGMVVAHFADLLESLTATPIILDHKPAAVELIDEMILDAAMSRSSPARGDSTLQGRPRALLIIELFDEDVASLDARLARLVGDLQQRGLGYAWVIVTAPAEQMDIWELRTSGLGLLMSRPGDRQPYAFVEDSAVTPAKLRDYIERFSRILDEEQVEQAGYYAHASVGCLHVRPVLNLKRAGDVRRMRRIADRVSSLALEFGGSMTGEHGDGMLRSCWLEKMYGPTIVAAFGRIKRTFDPAGLLNPGKIVSPMSMTDHLRYGGGFQATVESRQMSTVLDFGAHGDMLGLASMCSGVGQCRQRLVGSMCPSYMATADETHTTRARANALRMALSNRSLLDGLCDPALDDVMDLCLSCKACKSECPTGVDMARLKAEWLWQRHLRSGSPIRSRLIAALPDVAKIAGRWPGLANAVMQSSAARALMERLFGIDRRMPPPVLAGRSFRRWFDQHRAAVGACGTDKPAVIYFVDTWTDYFTPEVGVAAVRVLEAMGYRVVVPPTVCCGRPAISKGLLGQAKQHAERNVSILTKYVSSAAAIVGTEPSCLLTLVDELPQLVRTDQAKRIAEKAVTIETFIARAMRDGRDGLRFDAAARHDGDLPSVLYHGHCHEKAMIGTAAAMEVLRAVTGGRASEIESGCCGMAGSFGHEVEHYDVARATGAQRLFPAVSRRGEATIAVSGFSCRQQIEHHTDARPRHVIEIVASLLSAGRESPAV